MSCQLYMKADNLVFCGIALACFPDNNQVYIELYRNIQGDITK